ncbi:hypothetical protein [Duganella vulcania]|uniref:Uncharacterized protein n=1 Tax=Duganella vulcania TaxID=2692166 RepID=A0A845GG73_9BURK|nr:hypothetical protein [Duganella vulcania]MYM92510.1 hypothetical protein [Duganella vulcania]
MRVFAAWLIESLDRFINRERQRADEGIELRKYRYRSIFKPSLGASSVLRKPLLLVMIATRECPEQNNWLSVVHSMQFALGNYIQLVQNRKGLQATVFK